MDANLMFTQVTAGAACSYLLKLVQKWKAVPWVTEHTKGINIAVRMGLSALATIGINHVWAAGTDGSHVLTITIPAMSDVLIGAWHWFGQYALQHGWGQLLTLGNGQTTEVK